MRKLLVLVTIQFILAAVSFTGWILASKDRNAARAEVADLQKQLTDLKAKPRFHADAVRFFAISQPYKRTIVVSDATVILSDSDVPQLTQKILDWLALHPEEGRKRGIDELRAEVF